ncbi:hypothetical protein H5410_010770 [Solanum commersonii]|uniref:Secreted protein n=1 Tax=Solanum commersonii TaxID=4109 RepID=A0A9J6ALM2_SOLCO|nr:hypothetical protein H5410_010770 [Solanum commersonii]
MVYKIGEALLLWCCTSKLLLLLQPLFFGPLQPEMTPKVGATLPTTNASHPSTEGSSCSEIGQGGGQPSINDQQLLRVSVGVICKVGKPKLFLANIALARQ